MATEDLFGLPFEAPPPEDETGADGPPAEDEPQRRVWTVTSLTAAIRETLETRFGEVWLEGELSNCRLWQTGHLYFTLKDANAQIKAVMWRPTVRSLRFRPEDGLLVLARGRLSVYGPKGDYQIVCEQMEPQGAGALQLAFEQLKNRLSAEGLFARERKRPLPVLPRKIGIVTSLDGAAIRDILKVISRRHPNLHLVIRPSRVQGEGAAADIARGLQAVTAVPGVEVVIVGRGGGSIEDLWAFNEEAVARAIAASPVPVISAVGHETDFTIADFVADVRAPTPSAAAEMVVAAQDEFRARIDTLAGRARAATRRRVDRLRDLTYRLSGRPGLAGWPARVALAGRYVAELTHQLGMSGRALVARRERRYHELRLALETYDLRRQIGAVHERLARVDAALRASAVRAHTRADARFRGQAARLESLSPLAVLGRGYSVCWNEDRTRIIRDATTVQGGDLVRVTLQRGELACRVERDG